MPFCFSLAWLDSILRWCVQFQAQMNLRAQAHLRKDVSRDWSTGGKPCGRVMVQSEWGQFLPCKLKGKTFTGIYINIYLFFALRLINIKRKVSSHTCSETLGLPFSNPIMMLSVKRIECAIQFSSFTAPMPAFMSHVTAIKITFNVNLQWSWWGKT